MSDDELRALRREVRRLSYELGEAVAQVPYLWAMVECSRDGLALLDVGGAILECNRALVQILGADRATLIGAPLDRCLLAEAGEQTVAAALAAASPTEHPRVARTLAGEAVEWLLNPVKHGADSGERWVVSARALTDATVQARALREARRREASLSAALDDTSRGLAERGVLLHEVHHRVKNNLQIVSGLLLMHADAVIAPEARAALAETAQRVRSMALIHQQLYTGDHLARVDIIGYVQSLIRDIQSAIGDASSISVDADPLELPLAKAVPLGLLSNELLTNAFKHGRGPDGTCRVVLSVRVSDGRATLTIADEGPGLPDDFPARRRRSFGMSIVDALARQLGGKLEATTDRGARFRVAFPVV
ncbi:MAG: PAS domain-containing protein [Myxococcales bacterium]|nr:PAS domain-containing protein [Myxococcales bacterium]